MEEKGKKEMLEYQIKEFVRCVLDTAAREDKLDHMHIEINNHNGNLQMDYTLRERTKAY